MTAPGRADFAWTVPAVAGALLIVILTPAILWPGSWALLEIARGLASGAGADPGATSTTPASDAAAATGLSASAIAITLGVALLIGLLATALAWPVAWVIGRRPARWTALLMAPLLLPNYLVYSGWDLLRAPGSTVGDWLAAAAPWVSTWAGYALAVGGMALWAWPIAVIPLAAGVRGLGAPPLEAARMETRSSARAAALILGQLRGAAACAVALVALVALGSAVPLHLAQVPTHAIELWLLLDATGADERWRVWLASWPLALLAVAGAGLIVGIARAAEGSHRPLGQEPGGAGLAPKLAAWAIWSLATLAPLALFLRVTNAGAFIRFVDEMSDAMGASAMVAASVGALAALLAAAVGALAAAGPWSRRVALAAVAVTAVAALIPGALVGSITLRAWSSAGPLAPVADTPAIVALTHLARFGIVATLAGWWLARLEPRQLGEMRSLDGAGLGGWIRAAAAPMAPGLLAAGLCCAALSFHEIEAAVIVTPPVMSQGLPVMMLDFLHRTYLERLGAGAVLVMGVGLGAGIASCLLGWRQFAGSQFAGRLNPAASDPHKRDG